MVEDIKTKERYAMKTVPFTSEKKGVSKKQQKTIIKSAETEKQLLEKMDSENIVKIKGSFIIDRNPLKEIGSKRAAHLCILIEYIHGSDLNELLVNAEVDESIEIPLDCCIYWFLKLLETLKYIHSINIIHRDLKPDNILVEYGSYLEDFKKVKLKISDFGVGKELKEGGKASAISGQLFYTPPEVLKQEKGYDSRCDVWSLGIIFLQIYSKISIKTYQKAVHDIFKSIKNTPELNEKFCKRYGMKSMQNVSLLPLLLFMHENDLFYVVIERFVEDPGVSVVLNKMICPEDDRLKSNELLELKIIKTWKYILNLSNKIDKKDFDMLGIICFLGMKKYDQIIFTKCLDLLKENVSSNVEDFVRFNGIETLFKKLEKLRDLYKKKFLFDIILICVKILLHFHHKVDESETKKQLEENEQILVKIYSRLSVYLRKYNCSKALTQLVSTKYSIPVYFFSYLMSYNSQAIRFMFLELLQTFLLRINDKNKFVIMPLLKILLQHVSKKELETALKLYKFSDSFFFSHLTTEFKAAIAKDIVGKICDKLKKITKNELSVQVVSDTKKSKELEMHLFLLLCFLKDFESTKPEKVNNFNLYYNKAPSLKCKMKFRKSGGSQKKKVIFHNNVSKRLFSVNFNDEKEFVELISTEPICDFYKFLELIIGDKNVKEEFAIGYYELYVENSGWKDDVFIGIQTLKKQVLLNCASGVVGIFNNETNKEIQFEYKPFKCETGTYIGVGLTNKGNVFFTHNNTLITPFVEFITKKTNPKKGIFGLVKLNGNMGFKGLLNFGKRDYCFKFNKTKNEPRKVGKKIKKFNLDFISVNVLKKKDKKCVTLSTIQQKFIIKNSMSDIFITNIIKIVEDSKKKEKDKTKSKDEEKLQNYYSNFNKEEYKNVIDTFTKSGYVKELTKKHSNAKQDIFAKYKSLQQSQVDRTSGIGILEKEEIKKNFEKQIEKDKRKKRIFSSVHEDGIKDDLFTAIAPELLNRFLPSSKSEVDSEEEFEIDQFKVGEKFKKRNKLRKFFKRTKRERSNSLSKMLLSKKLSMLKQKELEKQKRFEEIRMKEKGNEDEEKEKEKQEEEEIKEEVKE